MTKIVISAAVPEGSRIHVVQAQVNEHGVEVRETVAYLANGEDTEVEVTAERGIIVTEERLPTARNVVPPAFSYGVPVDPAQEIAEPLKGWFVSLEAAQAAILGTDDVIWDLVANVRIEPEADEEREPDPTLPDHED